MTIWIRVEIGPSEDDLDQVLEIDLDDLTAVLADLHEGPLEWRWQLDDGAVMRLRAWQGDTPDPPPTPPG